MKEQTQSSVNLEIPSRWRRFYAYLLDLLINIIIWWVIPYIIFIFTSWSIASIIIGLILLALGIVFIIYERNTTWNELVWIISLNNENNPISRCKSMLRNFVFNPAYLPLLLFFICLWTSLVLYMVNSYDTYSIAYDDDYEESFFYNSFTYNLIRFFNKISWWMLFIGLALLFLNIVEIFFRCPTFIDKRLWIKRFYKKSKKNNE